VTLTDADNTFGQRKYAQALDQYRMAVAQAEKERNLQVQVEALAQMARCLSLTGKLAEGRGSLEKAARLASNDEPLGWSRYLGVRGIFERESGDRAKARKTFEEMYDYCVGKELHRRAVDAVHHIAIVVPANEQPEWALKGIREAEKLSDDAWLAVLWNNLGATYEDLKQYDKCLDAYRKARHYHHKSSDEHRKFVADWAVAHALRLAGKAEEAKELLEPLLAEAKRRHEKKPDAETLEWVGWCKKDLGECLVALGSKAEGTALIKEARAALVESRSTRP